MTRYVWRQYAPVDHRWPARAGIARVVLVTLALLGLAGCPLTRGATPPRVEWHAAPEPARGPATPQAVFDALWRDFDHHYPLFGAKGIHWEALRHQYRPQNPGPTSPEQALWQQLTGLLGALDDDHVILEAPGFGRFTAGSMGRAPQSGFRLDRVRTHYLREPRMAGGGRITYGLLAGGAGYVHLRDLTGITAPGNWPHEFDTVLQELRQTPALVLDLRGNQGGNHRVARFVAERFTQRRRHYLNIYEKTGPGHNDFGGPERWVLHPDAPFTYTRPVAVLTDGRTASAAEVLVLAMRQVPRAVQVGGTTAGSLGDMGPWRTLPNGWRYRMPINRFTDPDGRGYDGVGIAPQVPVQAFPAERDAGHDPVLERALAVLQERRR